jgi:hypothetical protein
VESSGSLYPVTLRKLYYILKMITPTTIPSVAPLMGAETILIVVRHTTGIGNILLFPRAVTAIMSFFGNGMVIRAKRIWNGGQAEPNREASLSATPLGKRQSVVATQAEAL